MDIALTGDIVKGIYLLILMIIAGDTASTFSRQGHKFLQNNYISNLLKDFKDEDFENKIKQEDVSVIQFSATWCSPCKVLKPVMDKLSSNYNANFYIADKKKGYIKKPYLIGELVYIGNNVSLGYANSSKDLRKGDMNKGKLFTGDLAY